MQLVTEFTPSECVRVFEESVRKRPAKLFIFPFRCDAPQVTDARASISAAFQLAEPYGMLRMRCEKLDKSPTQVFFSTDGNIRGRMVANSLAKHVAGKLS